ncbi:MAG: alkaline phosphatase family protein [Lentisphaerae bacterium]|nr:alkaline phosphatase family protein [Lentisphaerota bacterium]
MRIFLFIDALGWDIVGKTDYLRDLLPHRRAVTMQFGYSSSAIPTILSGVRPDRHGHLGLFAFAPERSPFKRVAAFMRLLRPKSFWNRGRVRGWLSRAVKRALGFTGYFQLYQMTAEKLPYMDYCERKNLFVQGGMAPVENLADALKRSGATYHISDWHLTDGRNLEIGEREIAKGTDFIFLYTAEMDALRHDSVTPETWKRVEAKLAWYRVNIERLVEAAKATGREWSLTVFSDHGMTPLSKTVDIKSAVEATRLRFGVDYGACYDSTMFRVHYLKLGSRATIESALAPFADDGHWLTEDEERRNGIWREDRAFGDAIFLVNPGVQIVPCDMGLKPLSGMHGYDPEDIHSKAAIMSTDPIPDWLDGVYDYFRLMKESIPKGTAK